MLEGSLKAGNYFAKDGNLLLTQSNISLSNYNKYIEKVMEFAVNISKSVYYNDIKEELNLLNMGMFCNDIDVFLAISRKYYPNNYQNLIVRDVNIAVEAVKRKSQVIFNSMPISSISFSTIKKYGFNGIKKMLDDYEEKLYQEDSQVIRDCVVKYRNMLNSYCGSVYDYECVVMVASTIEEELKKKFNEIKNLYSSAVSNVGNREATIVNYNNSTTMVKFYANRGERRPK